MPATGKKVQIVGQTPSQKKKVPSDMRRMILPLILGLLGAALLLWLGTWQLQRLTWKEGVLAEIEARIQGTPVALPETVNPEEDRYLPVTLRGRFAGETLRVLVSHRQMGAGYRLISVLQQDNGRRVMVDRGFLPVETALPELRPEEVLVAGNLHWPSERDGFTPENDVAGNIWFAREVPVMAAHLQSAPVLVIARQRDFDDPGVTLMPVGSAGIPNDHLQYAVTWFGLAAVWLSMLGLFLWRMYKTTSKPARGKDL